MKKATGDVALQRLMQLVFKAGQFIVGLEYGNAHFLV
ncbi:MAG: hypothetical protein K0S28_1133, partial [Paucimonas sp.]|nr:hypothetical protein [Paucimonas sp.]